MRTSARLAAKRQSAADINVHADFDGVNDDDENMEPSPPKRRKKGKGWESTVRKGRKRGPSLAALPSMPLDILYEIFALLQPMDLLHLSRTTKSLRAILLSRSATYAWKRSFSAVVMAPPIPDDISIPRLASLMFENYCKYCSTRTSNVCWECRVRICRSCVDEFFAEVPSTLLINAPKSIYKTLVSVLPNALTFGGGGSRVKHLRYPKETLHRYHDEYRALSENENPDALQQWIDEKKDHLKKLTEHARKCRMWQYYQEVRRQEELEELRQQRKDAILEKLTELGWGDEINQQDMDFLDNHAEGRKPQRLTEKGWLKIKDTMVDFMERVREDRIQEECFAICTRYMLMRRKYDDLARATPVRWRDPAPGAVHGAPSGTLRGVRAGAHNLLPPPGDILIHPTCRDLLLDLRTPLFGIGTVAANTLDSIPDTYVQQWRARCDAALVALACKHEAPRRVGEPDVLRLASTHFVVGAGRDVGFVGYPRVLADRRVVELGRCIAEFGNVQANLCDMEVLALTVMNCQPWSTNRVYFSMAMYERAREIVALVGGDADTETADGMDARDPWFRLEESEEAWQWRTVLYSPRPLNMFKLLGEDDARRARAQYEWRPRFEDEDAECAHCALDSEPQVFSTSALLYGHLAQEHGISIVKPTDFVLRLHSTLQLPGKVTLPAVTD
ncbi:hypothetical protein BD626DRAFT_631920 [Schizophyllum amplum]|uniref:F-box domain-containing protein n=1 Tax=Schizophyllum amplum TaxID=97359 RepID=A0A550C9M7_9AGAR|nr:hypothetical protein BD626DRAFT_631920 [Auriculariopsis ampla]